MSSPVSTNSKLPSAETQTEGARRTAAFCAAITVAATLGIVLYALRVPADSSGATERLALDPFTLWELALGSAVLRDPTTLGAPTD